MEGSKRTSTRIGDLSSLIFNKKQAQKKTTTKKPPYDREFVAQQYIKLL